MKLLLSTCFNYLYFRSSKIWLHIATFKKFTKKKKKKFAHLKKSARKSVNLSSANVNKIGMREKEQKEDREARERVGQRGENRQWHNALIQFLTL